MTEPARQQQRRLDSKLTSLDLAMVNNDRTSP